MVTNLVANVTNNRPRSFIKPPRLSVPSLSPLPPPSNIMNLNQKRKSLDGTFVPGFEDGYYSNLSEVTNQAPSPQAVSAATNNKYCCCSISYYLCFTCALYLLRSIFCSYYIFMFVCAFILPYFPPFSLLHLLLLFFCIIVCSFSLSLSLFCFFFSFFISLLFLHHLSFHLYLLLLFCSFSFLISFALSL